MPNNNPQTKKNNFYDQGFFSALMNEAREAMNNIDESRAPGLEEASQQQLRNQGRETLEALLVSSGMRDPEEVYINPDIELYDENGAPDEDKRDALLKSMVGHVAFNQSQWIFYPTTSKMTRLTEKAMEENGHDFIHMLPFEKRREHKAKKDLKNKDSSVVQTYLYPDGTASNKWYPEKGTLSFERLGFKSGFDFQAKYDPNKGIEKKTWQAGFNSEGEWEKFEKQSIVRPAELNRSDADTVKLMFLEGNQAWLFDEKGVFTENQVTEYFDVRGNLYGATQVDAAETASRISSQLAEMGVTGIAGIVSKNTGEADKERILSLFKNYVSDKTGFYSPKDEEPRQKLEEAELRAQNNELNVAVLANAVTAARIGLSGEEYVDLMQGKIKEAPVPLNIFDGKETMDLVLVSPELNLQPEERDKIKDYLIGQDIGQEKLQKVSNAVVNLLKSRDTLFSDGEHPEALDIVKQVVEYSLKEKPFNDKLLITRNLKDFILDQENDSAKDINKSIDTKNFRDRLSGENTFIKDSSAVSYNLFDAKERQNWISEELIHLVPEGTIEEIEKVIDQLNVDHKDAIKMNKPLRQSFLNYKNIAQGSGIRPAEIPLMVKAIVAEEPEAEHYANKNLIIEKKWSDVFQTAMVVNPLDKVNTRAELDFDQVAFSADSDIEIQTGKNIFTSQEELEYILAQPDLGLSQDESDDIKNLLMQHKVPVQDQQGVSNAIVNLLSNRQDLFSHQELLSPRDIVKGVIDFNKEKGMEGGTFIISSRLKEFIEDYDKAGSTLTRNSKIEINNTNLASMMNQAPFGLEQKGTQYNLFQEEERKKWINEELVYLIPSSSLDLVNNEIAKLNITQADGEELSRRIRHAFQNYKSIAQSTGTRPIEIPAMVKALFDGPDTPLAAKYLNKSVSVETNSDDLFKSAMDSNPHFRKIGQGDLQKDSLLKFLGDELREKSLTGEKSVSAMEVIGVKSSEDLNQFVYSVTSVDEEMLIPEGFDSQIASVHRIMNQARVPLSQSLKFKSNVESLIKNYFNSIGQGSPGKRKSSLSSQPLDQAIKNMINQVGGSFGQDVDGVAKTSDNSVGGNVNLNSDQYNTLLDNALLQLGINTDQGAIIKKSISSTLAISSKVKPLVFHTSKSEIPSTRQKILSTQRNSGVVTANNPPLTPLSYAIRTAPNGKEVNYFGNGLLSQIKNAGNAWNVEDLGSNLPANFIENMGQAELEKMIVENHSNLFNQSSGNMEFASSFKYLGGPFGILPNQSQMSRQSMTGQVPYAINQSIINKQFKQMQKLSSALSAEEKRMARINANYEADKKSIETSEVKAPQKMLAKSQNSEAGGAGNAKGKASDDYAIDKFRDDVLREIKDDCDL
ncbi:MAG: hypothetical protein JXR70_00305 [Spirochaetales bacterium]|nr:hypothetical protein [Spirochaetales bacterium]